MSYNSPSIPQLSTRVDFYRNHSLLSPHLYEQSDIILAFDVQHISSNYSTPVHNGTADVPRISVALPDGTLFSDTTNILNDILSQWATNCIRSTDGYHFGSVPLKISVSFDTPISSLATHTLSITARLHSNNIEQQYYYYQDQMIVSITVAPGNPPDTLYQRVTSFFFQNIR